MVVLKEFANFMALNMANLSATYARLLAESSAAYQPLPLDWRTAAGRKALNAVIEACRQQTSAPLVHHFEDSANRWSDPSAPTLPLVEVECLGQTLNPVVTNLEAGKFLWQALYEARLAVSGKLPSTPLAASTPVFEPVEDDLEGKFSLLRVLIDNLPEQIYVKDRQSRFLLANEGSRRALGAASVDEMLGKTDFDFSPREMAEKYYADEQAMFQSGQSLIGHEEMVLDRELGTTRWLSSTKVLFRDREGKIAGLVGMNRDITDRKMNQAKVARQAAELQIVAEVSVAISNILEVDELLQTVVDLTKEQFKLYHAHIYVLNETGDTLSLAAGAGEVGRAMVAQRWNIPLNHAHSLVAQAARTRRGVIVNDIRQNPDFLPNPLLPDTRSELAVPIMIQERVLGVLDVQGDQVDRFTDGDRRIKTTLAAQVAVALNNARLYAQTQAALTNVQASQSLMQTIINATPDWIFIKDRDFRYQLVNQSFANSLNMAPEEMLGKNDLELGFPEDAVKGNPEKGLPGFWPGDQEVLDSGQRKIIEVEPAVLGGGTQYLRSIKVPLKDPEGKVWGLLGFITDVTEREKLLAETRRRADETLIIQNIASALNSADSLIDSLPLLADQLRRLLPLDMLMLADNLSQKAELVLYSTGAKTETTYFARQGVRLPVQGTGFGWVLERNEVWLEEDLRQTKPFAEDEHLSYQGAAARLILPLTIGPVVVGALGLISTQPGAYNVNHLSLLWQVTDQFASAMERNRLFEKTQRDANREQTIREITDRIRSAANLNQLVKITAEELSRRFGAEYAVVDLGLKSTAQSPDGQADVTEKDLANG